jgi:uncharacterized protein (DUF305 family)
MSPRRRTLRLMTTRLLSATLLAGAATLAVKHGITPAEAAAPPSVASEQPFIRENDTAMNKMMADMTIKPTGDIDKDFVAMMVPHHQGAIDMAEAELRYGHNELLQRISQEIIAEQLQEIAAMRVAVGEKVSPYQAMLAASAAGSPAQAGPESAPPTVTQKDSLKSERPFLTETAAAMNKMMIDMNVKPTGNIDRDFVAMMIPHHQGAIDMAEAELRYGHSSRLRPVVQEIIVDQMNEIALMRLAVGETLPPSAASPTGVSQGPVSPRSTASHALQPTPMQMSSNQMNMK